MRNCSLQLSCRKFARRSSYWIQKVDQVQMVIRVSSIALVEILLQVIFMCQFWNFSTVFQFRGGVSHALIVLLPKTNSPNTFADFRPINLCNFFNKVLTRILCLRLKLLLPILIFEEQTAFIQGRDILDNILLAQEVLQHLEKGVRGHNLMFKLDMMKAFDQVRWDFCNIFCLN